MPVLNFDQVTKSYNGLRAVDGISLEVRGGEIFGLLGPNGAGKTTLIRMLMDIIRPDSAGSSSMGAAAGRPIRIGSYLPEERGLYRKQTVLDVLIYFAMLKGMPRRQAREKSLAALARVDLAETAKKKVEELSKGMQQKVQILSTLLHDPTLVVLDEPFSGLDPVNVRMVKEVLEDLKKSGAIVILSTHQMPQVEALCDRIAMLHRGHLMLYGILREIRRQHSGRALLLGGATDWGSFDSIETVEPAGTKARASLRDGREARDFLVEATARGIIPDSYESAEASLEEIFVKVVEGRS